MAAALRKLAASDGGDKDRIPTVRVSWTEPWSRPTATWRGAGRPRARRRGDEIRLPGWAPRRRRRDARSFPTDRPRARTSAQPSTRTLSARTLKRIVNCCFERTSEKLGTDQLAGAEVVLGLDPAGGVGRGDDDRACVLGGDHGPNFVIGSSSRTWPCRSRFSARGPAQRPPNWLRPRHVSPFTGAAGGEPWTRAVVVVATLSHPSPDAAAVASAVRTLGTVGRAPREVIEPV